MPGTLSLKKYQNPRDSKRIIKTSNSKILTQFQNPRKINEQRNSGLSLTMKKPKKKYKKLKKQEPKKINKKKKN